MRRLILVAVLPFLTACQTPEQQAALQRSDDQYCQSLGATGNAFAQCMMYKDQARRDERKRRSEAFIAAGAQLNNLAQQQNNQNKVTTTNCQRVGTAYVTCQSY